MSKIFIPAIYNETNPIGIDFELLDVQRRLACITWIESIFGRSKNQSRLKTDNIAVNNLQPDEGFRGDEKYKLYYPQGRKLDGDIDLSPDDSFASRCFFVCKDPINSSPKTDGQDWTSYNVEISQPMSLIFFGNLSKLELQSSEAIKNCLFYELNQCPKIVSGTCYENIENIWKEWTITQQINSFTRFPYYSIRIDFVLIYMAFPFNGRTDMLDPSTYENLDGLEIQPNVNSGTANNN